MKILLSMLISACLIVAGPYFFHDRQGMPYLEQQVDMLINYPAQYEAWQRITERFIPEQYYRDNSLAPEDVPPISVHTWRDAQGVTHFTDPGRESAPANAKIKTMTINTEHIYISQMPDRGTTYLLAATAWLSVTSLCYGLLLIFSKLYGLRTQPEVVRFSRSENMQAINEQKAEEKARKAVE